MDESTGELTTGQGKEQQVITPELKLSRELWATCVNLLRERGKTIYSVTAFLNLLFRKSMADLHIPGVENKAVVFDQLVNETEALRSITSRRVRVEEEGSKTPSIITICGMVNPIMPGLPPYEVDVYISPKNNESQVNLEFLRLREDRRPEIMRPRLDRKRLIRRDRWATPEDLTYYQNKINSSSPIEHK